MNMIGQSAKYIVVLGGLILLAFLVIVFNNRMAEQRQLVAQAEEIQAELEALQLTDANLDAQIAYATSDLAVEEWAYQEARWVREGDFPVVPVSPSTPTPIAALLRIHRNLYHTATGKSGGRCSLMMV